jgi:dTDP-4-amino-4,6-dideoxygalactose transaminase
MNLQMKKNIYDLAIFGGEPEFDQILYVGQPNISNRSSYIANVEDILDRKVLTNQGRFLQQLEEQLREILGVKHCILISNGTTGLEIAIRALELQGEVIVPSHTFIATVHAILWLGLKPVFCDINHDTHNINPKLISKLISPQTSAILGVHLWGRACEIDEITNIAQRAGIRVFFDAAHAFHCSHKGRMIGNFGDLEVFSFHATKFFNTLEGGAITTNNDELANKIRLMKNFGFVDYDRVVSLGINGKLNEISAAFGMTLLDDLENILSTNYENYRHYEQLLANLPGFKMVKYDQREKCNYQYIVFEIDEHDSPLSRDQIVEILWAENILARRYFFPGCHRMQPYRSLYTDASLSLPITEQVVSRTISLPNGFAVNSDSIDRMSQLITFICSRADQIDALMSTNKEILKSKPQKLRQHMIERKT